MELMTSGTQLHFPNWPPRRLVTEAIFTWGCRHLDEPYIDCELAPWPVVRGVVLAFLRHQMSDYQDRLRARCEHDPAFRDELARKIEQAAYRKYPWLSNDPRPFAQGSGDSLFLDSMAKELADLRGVHDQLLSAVKDLRRTGGSKDHVSALQSEAADIAKQIQGMYTFLTRPKAGEDANGHWARAFILRRDGERRKWRYDFYSSLPLPPNRIEYTGIQCSHCGASVARRKQLIDLGQGYSRVGVWSCHCLTYAVYRPYGWRTAPLMFEEWKEMVQRTERRSPST
jgi:hypothetical protein